MEIFIGNVAAKEWHDAPVLDANGQLQSHPETGALLTERKSRRLEGSRVTAIQVDVGADDGQYSRKDLLTLIGGPGGIWDRESHEKPAWVSVPSSQALQDLLAEEFGCPSGVPADWDGPDMTDAAAEATAALQATADAAAGAAVSVDTQVVTPADVAAVPAAVLTGTEPTQ